MARRAAAALLLALALAWQGGAGAGELPAERMLAAINELRQQRGFEPLMAEEVIRNERADLVALGRVLLREPYWPLRAAHELGIEVDWPPSYTQGGF